MNKLGMRDGLNERGQSLVLIAIFFFLVFLGFAALGVDGTMIYLRRRQMQNIADAAALAAAEQLSQGNGEAVAYQEAMDSIAGNDGRIEWYSTSATPNPPTTNLGSGLDLVQGIQITNACDVRVALRWSDAGTYFTQFLGRDSLEVGARAHAGCNRAGGLMPIAVKRFGDEFDTSTGSPKPNKKDPNTIYCGDTCDTRLPLASQGNGTAYDFLLQSGSDVITNWPEGALLFQSPSPFANPGSPGREYYILGGDVEPNVGKGAYGGWVNLDIRHISSAPRLYYNGVNTGTNAQTLKDLGEYYIRRGYCCDIPAPGDEVAVFNGVSADFAAKAFQETYKIGDVIAVIVYNGTVFQNPDLGLVGSPQMRHTRPATTTVAALNSAAVTYTIRLEALDQFHSSTGGLTMNVEGLEGFADWSFSPTSSPVLPPYTGGPDVITLTLHLTPTATTTVTMVGTTTVTSSYVVTGTRMFYVSAIDDKEYGTDIMRYWAGHISVGDVDSYGMDRDLPAVTGMPTNTEQMYPFVVVEQGEHAHYSIDLNLWGGAVDQPVTVRYAGAVGHPYPNLPTGFTWVAAPPWTDSSTQASNHPGGSFTLNIKVEDTATPNKLETLKFVTTAGGLTQTFNLYILVVPPKTADPENYVQILGYAAVEVRAYPKVNSVRGRIISELMADPSDLTYGLRARLIPWEQ